MEVKVKPGLDFRDFVKNGKDIVGQRFVDNLGTVYDITSSDGFSVDAVCDRSQPRIGHRIGNRAYRIYVDELSKVNPRWIRNGSDSLSRLDALLEAMSKDEAVYAASAAQAS